MLKINTKKEDREKLVEIDGHTFKVRQPGAGEALTLQEAGRKIGKLQSIKEMTEEQKEDSEVTGMSILRICLSLFSTDSEESKDYLQKLDAEILFNVVDQIFGVKDEPKTPAEA